MSSLRNEANLSIIFWAPLDRRLLCRCRCSSFSASLRMMELRDSFKDFKTMSSLKLSLVAAGLVLRLFASELILFDIRCCCSVEILSAPLQMIRNEWPPGIHATHFIP